MVRTAQQDRIKANYWLRDHDTFVVAESPPVRNDWYEVMHEQDVRLLVMAINQTNGEVANKDIEIRWTVDENVYLRLSAVDQNVVWVTRNYEEAASADCLLLSATQVPAAIGFIDKRGLDFLIEIRMTSVLGTNQTLLAWAVAETLEVT